MLFILVIWLIGRKVSATYHLRKIMYPGDLGIAAGHREELTEHRIVE